MNERVLKINQAQINYILSIKKQGRTYKCSNSIYAKCVISNLKFDHILIFKRKQYNIVFYNLHFSPTHLERTWTHCTGPLTGVCPSVAIANIR